VTRALEFLPWGIAAVALLWMAARAWQTSKALTALATLYAEAHRSLELARAGRDHEERRADDFFALIQGVEKEAQGWRKEYEELLRGALVAQDMLINRMNWLAEKNALLVRLCRKNGLEVSDAEISKELQEKLQSFREKRVDIPHVDASGAAQEIQARAEAAKAEQEKQAEFQAGAGAPSS